MKKLAIFSLIMVLLTMAMAIYELIKGDGTTANWFLILALWNYATLLYND